MTWPGPARPAPRSGGSCRAAGPAGAQVRSRPGAAAPLLCPCPAAGSSGAGLQPTPPSLGRPQRGGDRAPRQRRERRGRAAARLTRAAAAGASLWASAAVRRRRGTGHRAGGPAAPLTCAAPVAVGVRGPQRPRRRPQQGVPQPRRAAPEGPARPRARVPLLRPGPARRQLPARAGHGGRPPAGAAPQPAREAEERGPAPAAPRREQQPRRPPRLSRQPRAGREAGELVRAPTAAPRGRGGPARRRGPRGLRRALPGDRRPPAPPGSGSWDGRDGAARSRCGPGLEDGREASGHIAAPARGSSCGEGPAGRDATRHGSRQPPGPEGPDEHRPLQCPTLREPCRSLHGSAACHHPRPPPTFPQLAGHTPPYPPMAGPLQGTSLALDAQVCRAAHTPGAGSLTPEPCPTPGQGAGAERVRQPLEHGSIAVESVVPEGRAHSPELGSRSNSRSSIPKLGREAAIPASCGQWE